MNGDMGGFATFDNINNKLIDDLKVQLREGCKLQIAAASFSIYAFEALKEELAALTSVSHANSVSMPANQGVAVYLHFTHL